MDLKKLVLEGLRVQWSKALRDKFHDDPEKLRQADMNSLAEEMFGHATIQGALGSFGVTKEEIAEILSETRDELLIVGREVDYGR